MKNTEVENFKKIKDQQSEIITKMDDWFLELIDISNTLLDYNSDKNHYIFFILGKLIHVYIHRSVITVYNGLFGESYTDKTLLRLERSLIPTYSADTKISSHKWSSDIKSNLKPSDLTILFQIKKRLEIKLQKINKKLSLTVASLERLRSKVYNG